MSYEEENIPEDRPFLADVAENDNLGINDSKLENIVAPEKYATTAVIPPTLPNVPVWRQIGYRFEVMSLTQISNNCCTVHCGSFFKAFIKLFSWYFFQGNLRCSFFQIEASFRFDCMY